MYFQDIKTQNKMIEQALQDLNKPFINTTIDQDQPDVLKVVLLVRLDVHANINLQEHKHAFKSGNLCSKRVNYTIKTDHVPDIENIKVNCNTYKIRIYFREIIHKSTKIHSKRGMCSSACICGASLKF